MAPEHRKADAPPDATSAQLKDDIDAGRTGDKVAHPDPAAAPLGADADAEAGGRPPTPDTVAATRDAETAQGAAPTPGRSSGATRWIAVGAGVVVLLILAGLFL